MSHISDSIVCVVVGRKNRNLIPKRKLVQNNMVSMMDNYQDTKWDIGKTKG